jgi:hypothetical protein
VFLTCRHLALTRSSRAFSATQLGQSCRGFRAVAAALSASLGTMPSPLGMTDALRASMIRNVLLSAFLFLAATNCSSTDGAAPAGSPGLGGSGGAAGGTPPADGGAGGSPHPELCGIAVTCHDGVLSGMFGIACNPFTGVCPLGCRVPVAGTNDLSLDPLQFAQTLCLSPSDDAGDASVDDAHDR